MTCRFTGASLHWALKLSRTISSGFKWIQVFRQVNAYTYRSSETKREEVHAEL